MRGGFSLIPVLVGAYGLAEVFAVMREKTHIKIPKQVGRILPKWVDIAQNWFHMLRSGVIGVIIGIIPGVARTWPPGSPMISLNARASTPSCSARDPKRA